MKTVLKFALILGGVGYLLKDQITAALHINTAATPGNMTADVIPVSQTAPPSQTAPSTPATNVIATTAATTRDLLLAKAQGNGWYINQNNMLDGWQWSNLYQQVRGTAPPDPTTYLPDAARLMTLDEWWAAAQASAGLSGLGRRRPPQYASRVWGAR